MPYNPNRRDWQDAETAPRDGTLFLACDAKDEEKPQFITSWRTDVYGGPGWFSDNYSDTWGDRPIFDHFTHWIPLPLPPGSLEDHREAPEPEAAA